MERTALPPLPESPHVSVVLTSYNYAAYVREAIDGVFAQTYRPLDLIIVDDGSTDGSPEVIRAGVEHAPIPVRVIVQENQGQAAALNAGLALAQGEIICLLDSDDTWRPEKVAAMVAFIREHPGGGVYQHQMERGEAGAKQELLPNQDLFAAWRALGTVNVAVHPELVSVFLPTSGLAFRREVLERILPIPAELRSCPDAYLTRTACVHGPLYSNPRVLGRWRDHGANAGKRGRFTFRNFWVPVVMPAINRHYAEHDIPIRLTYRPWAVLREPPGRILMLLKRRINRIMGRRP